MKGIQYQNHLLKKSSPATGEQDPSHARVRLHQCTTAAIAVGVILPKVGANVLAVLLFEAMDPRNRRNFQGWWVWWCLGGAAWFCSTQLLRQTANGQAREMAQVLAEESNGNSLTKRKIGQNSPKFGKTKFGQTYVPSVPWSKHVTRK